MHVGDGVPELLGQHPRRGEAEHRGVEVPRAVAPDHQAEVLLNPQAGGGERVGRWRRFEPDEVPGRRPRLDQLGDLITRARGRRQGGEHLVGPLEEEATTKGQLGVAVLVDDEPVGDVEGPGAHPVVRWGRAQLELVQPGRRSVGTGRPVRRSILQVGRQAGVEPGHVGVVSGRSRRRPRSSRHHPTARRQLATTIRRRPS
jgi:hypothetical protein